MLEPARTRHSRDAKILVFAGFNVPQGSNFLKSNKNFNVSFASSKVNRIYALQQTPADRRRRIYCLAITVVITPMYGTFMGIPLATAIILAGLTGLAISCAFECSELKRRLDRVVEILEEDASLH